MAKEGLAPPKGRPRRGQERARKALKARPKKVWKIEGAAGARDSENLPGRVCPTIRGRLPRKPPLCNGEKGRWDRPK